MNPEAEIESADEIVFTLAMKALRDRWLAALAVRLLKSESGLPPLKCYPESLREFVTLHSTT